jgi:CelD/BcsL family acetyltransferase involved in cellulose biosynthesis
MLKSPARASALVGTACPFVSVSAAGDFHAWIAERPTRLGKRLRQNRRRLEREAGPIDLSRLTREQDVVEFAPTFWGLHLARWQPRGGSDAVCTREVQRFHADSMRELARRGWASIYVLKAGGKPLAGIYGFETGNRFEYYQSGFDPAWAHASVGLVLLGAVLEDVFDRRLAEFDFLRGEESYKHAFTTWSRAILSVRVGHGIRGRALGLIDRGIVSSRHLARRAIPRRMIARLQQYQRRYRR